ncbi:hypothetical protein CFIICLFH_4857 [Methylobacterium goesingense]|uniref:Uncharacterized protein n=1 Tax=Methylobacterium goesingense TaxID=243690 RepID=A0ABV2LFX2_9HYPH|nr:hypothetical protein CFIICLFH_4857 [Methylobacterium goesingense]
MKAALFVWATIGEHFSTSIVETRVQALRQPYTVILVQ